MSENKKREKLHGSAGLVFWKCLVDNNNMNANPRARNPPKSSRNRQKSTVKRPQPLPTCWGWGAGGWVGRTLGGRGGWGGWECTSTPPPPPACGKRWCVLHYGFLQIVYGFWWISCTWIRTYIFIIYKAFTEDKSLLLNHVYFSSVSVFQFLNNFTFFFEKTKNKC